MRQAKLSRSAPFRSPCPSERVANSTNCATANSHTQGESGKRQFAPPPSSAAENVVLSREHLSHSAVLGLDRKAPVPNQRVAHKQTDQQMRAPAPSQTAQQTEQAALH